MKKFLSFIFLFSVFINSNAFSEELKKCSSWITVSKWTNCIGEYKYQDGNYIGAYKDGVPNGKGRWSNNEGSVYVGDFINFKFDGMGTMEIKDQYKYSGEFKDSLFHGNGLMTCLVVKNIMVNLKMEMNGQGNFSWPDGGTL